MFFNWTPPKFAHLPLILKPTGKGKLSKRDGDKGGFPVFPLEWKTEDNVTRGFREDGYLPEAVVNFLAFLGVLFYVVYWTRKYYLKKCQNQEF